MIDLTKVATEAHPLHASALHRFVSCPWSGVALMFGIESSDSGKAADTGSALHLAVANFHRGDKEQAAIAKMREAAAAFPLADMDEAERIFGAYLGDPRNRHAEVVEVEKKVAVSIPAWIEGEAPIVIRGTVDQVRRVEGRLEVWDIKTGNRDGAYMQNNYLYQLAAYTLGIPGAKPGGYIRTKGYFTRGAELPEPRGVFISACFDDPLSVLDPVRLAVSLVRSGNVTAHPGDHCGFCPMSAFEFCLPRLKAAV